MSWAKSGVTETYHDDKKVLTATFDTLDGANMALKALEKAEKHGPLDAENTITHIACLATMAYDEPNDR